MFRGCLVSLLAVGAVSLLGLFYLFVIYLLIMIWALLYDFALLVVICFLIVCLLFGWMFACVIFGLGFNGFCCFFVTV